MAARRPQPPRPITRAASTNLGDPKVSRAVDEVRTAAQSALDRREVFSIGKVLLSEGGNVVKHGIGRAPVWVGLTPTAVLSGFDWAWDDTQPLQDLQIMIDLVFPSLISPPPGLIIGGSVPQMYCYILLA